MLLLLLPPVSGPGESQTPGLSCMVSCSAVLGARGAATGGSAGGTARWPGKVLGHVGELLAPGVRPLAAQVLQSSSHG